MDGLKLASSWSRAGLKRLVQQERGETQIVDVRGLLIQGAAFDSRALVEAEAARAGETSPNMATSSV